MKTVTLNNTQWAFVLSAIDSIADCYVGDNEIYTENKTMEQYARELSDNIWNQINLKNNENRTDN